MFLRFQTRSKMIICNILPHKDRANKLVLYWHGSLCTHAITRYEFEVYLQSEVFGCHCCVPIVSFFDLQDSFKVHFCPNWVYQFVSEIAKVLDQGLASLFETKLRFQQSLMWKDLLRACCNIGHCLLCRAGGVSLSQYPIYVSQPLTLCLGTSDQAGGSLVPRWPQFSLKAHHWRRAR